MTDHPEGRTADVDFEIDGCGVRVEVEVLAPFAHSTVVVRMQGVETVAISLSDPTGHRRLAEHICGLVWWFGQLGGAT
ncbi:MAG: hypothetical protein H0U22_08845 [Geodermatophilaceae bacterium]|nr:hypothetical protein [Geodermatophilaceae bacterium]